MRIPAAPVLKHVEGAVLLGDEHRSATYPATVELWQDEPPQHAQRAEEAQRMHQLVVGAISASSTDHDEQGAGMPPPPPPPPGGTPQIPKRTQTHPPALCISVRKRHTHPEHCAPT